jgi:methyl-accepting chemotaxis protein
MKWTVGTKIGGGFAMALAILIFIGGASYRSTAKLTDTAEWVTHTHLVLERLSGLIQALTDAETGQRGFVITGDEQYLETYQSGILPIDQYLREIRSLTSDNPHQQQRLDLLDPLVAQRIASLKEGVDVEKTRGLEAARQWVATGKGKREMDDTRKIVGDMRDEEQGLLKIRNDEAKSSAENLVVTIIAGTLSAFAILSIAGFFITRNISKPLKQITALAEQIAAGDLDVPETTNTRRQDEVGILAQTFTRMGGSLREMAQTAAKIADGDLQVNVKPQSPKDMLGNAFALMIENLRILMTQIAEGVNVLSTSASQISTSTTQLATTSAEAATAVSETTATVEEVRQTAQLANQKAKSVSENTQKMTQISQTGTKSTEETIEGINIIQQQMESIGDTMVRLSDQSQTIGRIVATVEDLAAQSNLLAVNASIEAAKAGEQGKGFAVVAQEVKSLAEQSQQATNQVRNILTDIRKATSAAVMATEQGSKAVEAGVKRSGQAGQSIQMLSGSVTEAAQAATQIAASSQQQLVGMDQVALAMESIKEASTQNMASAKQLESAAHNLKELGQKLQHTVAKYKV